MIYACFKRFQPPDRFSYFSEKLATRVTFTTHVRYFETFTGHGHGVSTSERNISFTILGLRVTR